MDGFNMPVPLAKRFVEESLIVSPGLVICRVVGTVASAVVGVGEQPSYGYTMYEYRNPLYRAISSYLVLNHVRDAAMPPTTAT